MGTVKKSFGFTEDIRIVTTKVAEIREIKSCEGGVSIELYIESYTLGASWLC